MQEKIAGEAKISYSGGQMTKRSKDQTLVAFPLDRAFLASVDEVRGAESRSAFIREALAQFLRLKGVPVPEKAAASPDRVGKGGPKKKAVKYTENQDEVPLGKVAETAPKKKRRKEP